MNSPPSSRTEVHPRPQVIGVLGGIASGKSAVARLLAGENGLVLDADRLAHEALDSPPVQAAVLEAFGASLLGPEGKIDRGRLGERVFGDPEARKRLEHWIHPVVRARIVEGLEEARAQGLRRVLLDVPLLLENDAEHGLAALCDFLVFVDSRLDQRDARAQERRGWKTGEVARREALQLPLPTKRDRADYVVMNHGSLDELASSVAQILTEIDSD